MLASMSNFDIGVSEDSSDYCCACAIIWRCCATGQTCKREGYLNYLQYAREKAENESEKGAPEGKEGASQGKAKGEEGGEKEAAKKPEASAPAGR